jgi:NADH-quinone oxidoreductase subunit J
VPHLIFFGLAVIALVGAFLVVLSPRAVYSALALIVCFIATAGLLLQLGAQFMAFLQIIIYAGAIMVLFLFVIMLLDPNDETFSPNRLIKLAVLIVPLGILMTLLLINNFPLPSITAANWDSIMSDDVKFIGNSLFRDYLLPFEVTSILILVAILGAVVLTKRPNH